jgi:hypothetical protein
MFREREGERVGAREWFESFEGFGLSVEVMLSGSCGDGVCVVFLGASCGGLEPDAVWGGWVIEGDRLSLAEDNGRI